MWVSLHGTHDCEAVGKRSSYNYQYWNAIFLDPVARSSAFQNASIVPAYCTGIGACAVEGIRLASCGVVGVDRLL